MEKEFYDFELYDVNLQSMKKNSFISDEEIKKIINILIEHINPYLIYLFGSAVKGCFKEDSDIDIGFVSDMELSDYDVFMVAQSIADELKKEVDLINLIKSSTVFKAQVVGTGKVIYCSDNLRRMNFEMYTLKDYALLNEERKVILDNITKRGNVYGK